MSELAIQRLRNPPTEPIHIENQGIQHLISVYLTLEHASQQAFEQVCQSTAHNLADSTMAKDILTFAATEQVITQYMGIESIEHNMCPQTCLAFTGPYAVLDK